MKKFVLVVVFVFLFAGIATAQPLVKIFFNKGMDAIWVMEGKETLLRKKLNDEQVLHLGHIADGCYEAEVFQNGAIDILNIIGGDRASFIYLTSADVASFVGRPAIFVAF